MKTSIFRSGNLDHWIQMWTIIALMMLVLATVVSLANRALSARDKVLVVGFGILYATWYWVFIRGLPHWGRKSSIVAITFVLMIALTGGMAFLHPIYYWVLFSLYGVAFGVLWIGYAIPVVIWLSSVGAAQMILVNRMAISQAWTVIFIFGVSTVFGSLLGLFIHAIFRQSLERQKIIDELQKTRAELAAAERQAGILEERQRLAREIHDTLAQGFSSIVMHLEAADQALPPTAPAETSRQHLDRARQVARDSLTEARRLVWALRPESLERESLDQALARVVLRWSEENGIPASTQVTGMRLPLVPAIQVALLRCAQEGLSNIRKHARASQVTLTLSYLDDAIILDVQDDGGGFSLEDQSAGGPDAGGFGLIGMRERVEALGGSLTLESEPGEGATLVVQLPLALQGPEEQVHEETR
jgi:signal transduction histidine kinase